MFNSTPLNATPEHFRIDDGDDYHPPTESSHDTLNAAAHLSTVAAMLPAVSFTGFTGSLYPKTNNTTRAVSSHGAVSEVGSVVSATSSKAPSICSMIVPLQTWAGWTQAQAALDNAGW